MKKSIQIHSNDKLSRLVDGSFLYTDSYGETTDLYDAETVRNWAIEEDVFLGEEVEAFIDQE